MSQNPNNPDNFVFGDDNKQGVPSVLVDLSKINMDMEQLEGLAAEFYGRIAENQLAVAGDGGTDEIIVAFLPDTKNPSDTFSCRRSFIRALTCHTIQ